MVLTRLRLKHAFFNLSKTIRHLRVTMPDNSVQDLVNPSHFNPWRFCTAPCMDWTDRHCRQFWRGLSRHSRLYTEMITTGAILHGDTTRFLRFDPAEQPVALQLGGSDAQALARCAAIAEEFGYAEVNLNCGCPSDRVQNGRFGACLMREPAHVADLVRAMMQACRIPVTVKHRIGVDDCEDYAFLRAFVLPLAEVGVRTFIVHARKAWLSGLSPKENREIPPLTYEHVYRLKQEFPELCIVINGGIKTMAEALQHLQQIDGVMMGREAYENPWILSEVDPVLFNTAAPVEHRRDALLRLRPYIAAEAAKGTPLAAISRHLLGLYRGQSGGRQFRRVISERAHAPHADFSVLLEALAMVEAPAPEPISATAFSH